MIPYLQFLETHVKQDRNTMMVILTIVCLRTLETVPEDFHLPLLEQTATIVLENDPMVYAPPWYDEEKFNDLMSKIIQEHNYPTN